MDPQVCNRCGRQSGGAVLCAACSAAPSPPPRRWFWLPKPTDADGWQSQPDQKPPSQFFAVLRIIASVVGLTGIALLIVLAILAALND